MVGMTCPFCDSGDVERVAQWGGQIITSQWRCSTCASYFEAVRDDFDDELGSGIPPLSRSS
jgi:transposase-like protein